MVGGLAVTIQHRSVFSSHIDKVGYDPASGELHVTYKTGQVAIHEGVPPGVAQQVTGAASIGKAIHQHIRGQYSHRYEGS